MNSKQWQKTRRLSLVRRLQAAGVPLDLTQDPTEDGLLIRQVGGPLETCAFDLSCGGTGYLVNLCITVNCPVLGILSFGLTPSWNEPSIQWVADPRETQIRPALYRLPGKYSPEYETDLVINHFADLKRKFYRGHFFQGFLMGFGSKPIPDDIGYGPSAAFVTVNDQYEDCYSSPIELFIDRSQKSSNLCRKRPTRRRIFDQPSSEYTNALS